MGALGQLSIGAVYRSSVCTEQHHTANKVALWNDDPGRQEGDNLKAISEELIVDFGIKE
jgi:hypothetical protein